MFASTKEQKQSNLLPTRFNKHFRIKSASKDKIKPSVEILTVKTRRKDNIQEMKRIFSESRKQKTASLDTAIKIRITKQEFEKKFEKVVKSSKKKTLIYASIKTEDEPQVQSNIVCQSYAENQDQNLIHMQKQAKYADPSNSTSHQTSTKNSKLIAQPQRFKKIKNQKQPKGRYRCRVNQFVFDQGRRKSNFSKEQQQTLDQFWKNVNQSLILAEKHQEQMSKDLQQVIQHFVTE